MSLGSPVEPDPAEEEAQAASDDEGEGLDWEEEPEPEEGPVILRPLPGFDFNPIVGGGSALIGAFEERREPSAGYVAEVPGEVLLVVEGERPAALTTGGFLLLALTLISSPFVAYSGEVHELFLPQMRPQLLSALLASFVIGIVLASFMLTRLFRAGSRATLTSQGVAVEASQGATWTEWVEIRSYAGEVGQGVSLRLEEGSLELLPSREESERLIGLLEQRGIPRV